MPENAGSRPLAVFAEWKPLMIDFEQVEKLKRDFTDKWVVVDERRPELARFKGQTGKVKTVNMSGRALVEFDAYNNIGWYDIDLDFLKVVEAPLPKAEEKAEKTKKEAAPKAKAAAPAAEKKLSPLEMARLQGAAKKEGAAETTAPAAGEKKLSPLEMARLQGAAKKEGAAKAEATAPAAGAKKSTADILAAARAKATPKAAPPPASEPASPEPAPVETPKAESPPAKEVAPTGPKKKLTVAEMLAAARAEKKK